MTTTEEKAKKNQERTEKSTPKCCPKCGGGNLTFHLVEWFAHSMDPCNMHNTAELWEHQCHACGISFWM